ncbi:MAG TPA: tetratricopeptide repeat protein [Planctomycetota bacterium]|jgi:tetratricopeptide (TPR) repeat protein|nr:tetratricopeptide repeat protein [Planctomycetota bacterium]
MALWDKIFKKKDEGSGGLNPIVQKNPPPPAPVRVSTARPAAKPAAKPPPANESSASTKSRYKSSDRLPKVEETVDTKSRKKKEETGTRSRPGDDAAFVKRGIARQQKGEHDAAIADFTKAIELNPDCVQAYASRGVSKDAQGDTAGAKSDYSKSIQIQIMVEINRQMRDNPDVEV